MATPDIGAATALRGNSDIVEKLGRMQFQANEADKNRQLKSGLEAAKQQKKDLEQFEIPTGKYNRLVLPELEKTQTEYKNKLVQLKQERPNDYGNALNNLALEYKNKMNFFSTLSKDLDSYETQTASVDKGGMYFSKQQKKFNPIYEKSNSLTEFYSNLEKAEVYGDASLQIRPNGSVSFTPIPDRKPIKTIEDEIVKSVTAIPFTSRDLSKKYGYSTEKISARPVTNNPGIYGISKAEIAQVNPELARVTNSIEDIVDDWMVTSLGNGGVFQYADQNDLPYNMDQEGNLTPESAEVIKDHIMNWASNYSSPKVTTSFVKEPTNFNVTIGDKEEGSIGTPDYEPSELASVIGGGKTFKFGELGYTFDKDPQSISVTGQKAFDAEFRPAKTSTLTGVKADGILILAVDAEGKPMRFSDVEEDNKKNIAGSDVFVRVKGGQGYYYVKFNNYAQITNQFQKKPTEALQKVIQAMIIKSAKLDTKITNWKKKGGSWSEINTLAQ